jgi:hypothetical protein
MAKRIFGVSASLALALCVFALSPYVDRARGEVLQPTTTIFLPNIVKTLGGPDGWNTPFIVQNVGSAFTNVTFEFYSFTDGALVKTRTVSALAPGTSVFHSPNHDPDLAEWSQYSVVLKSFGSPVVAVVNEHQSEANPQRQEALSYDGLTSGSTNVYLPFVAAVASGWYCTVIAQNFTGTPANVTAAFKSFDGSKTAQLARSIPARGSKFIDPRYESALVAGTEYAVALTSTQEIGVVVNCHNDDATVPTPRAFSYNGSAATNEMTAFGPYAAKNVTGRNSRVIVQNVGTTPVQPVLHLEPLGGTTINSIDGPASLQPGAAWAYDLSTSNLSDGERTVRVTGGQFALLVETRSTTSAMAYTGKTEWATRLYLPNITRTLGGPTGWTTPIVVQSQGSFIATMSWYRFADGVLVHTQQLVLGLDYGDGIKIDPRAIPQLADNTQYAVVIESSWGGVGAVVLEMNERGGDSAMAYEAMTAAPIASFGTSNCTPSTGVSGSTFHCRMYGFPPGTTSVNLLLTVPGNSGSETFTDYPVAADGSWAIVLPSAVEGVMTVAVTAGGVTKTTQVTVTAPTFGVQITQSQNGSITATSKPGAWCAAQSRLPTGDYSQATGLNVVKQVPASGTVSWSYTADPGGGNATHELTCTVGAESHRAMKQYPLI